MAITLQRNKILALIEEAHREVVLKQSSSDDTEDNSAAPSQTKENGYTSMTIDDLRREVEKINSELTELGGGAAFKWLTKSEIGYKEYMSHLLEVRKRLKKGVSLSEEEQKAAPQLVAELKEKADHVRAAVSSEPAATVDQSVETKEIVADNNQDESEPVPDVPSTDVTKTEVNASVVTETVDEKVDEAKPAHIEVVEDKEEETSIPIKKVSEAPEEPKPSGPQAALNITPMKSGALEKEGESVAEKKEEVAQTPSAPVEAASKDDALMTREVTTALNQLLTEWLGGGGFLGMGKSGLEHPDFVATRNLLVSDLVEGDVPAELKIKPDTLASIKANVQAWKENYSVYPEPQERFEKFLRRVVVASNKSG